MRYNGRVVWIWCWLGVLVASCGQSTLPDPTSQTRLASLLEPTRPPGTLTPSLRLVRTPTLRATSMIVETQLPTPLPLANGSPDCYETPVGGLWCLGLVRNSLAVPIERVIVRVYLVTIDGDALMERETSIVRSALQPGSASPYGVLFDDVPLNAAGPVAILISAIEAHDLASRMIPIAVENVRTDLNNPMFHITGTLANRASTPIHAPSLTIALFDAVGRVTGFRQWRWPDDQVLHSGDVLPFVIDIIPQGRSTIRIETYAEGVPG